MVRKKCSSSRFELNRVNRKPGRDLGEPRGGSPGKSRSSEWEELYVYWNCLWIWYRSIISIDCEDIVCARISRDLVPYRERTRWTIGGLRGLIDRPTEKQCAVSFFSFFLFMSFLFMFCSRDKIDGLARSVWCCYAKRRVIDDTGDWENEFLLRLNLWWIFMADLVLFLVLVTENVE